MILHVSKYSSTSTCPKCGHVEVLTSYLSGKTKIYIFAQVWLGRLEPEQIEQLLPDEAQGRQCGRCHFCWFQLCQDHPEDVVTIKILES